MMNQSNARELLTRLLSEVSTPDGVARTDQFDSLRSVDGKVRELLLVLNGIGGALFEDVARQVENDVDFQANSRRVRLEATANHARTALRFLGKDGSNKKEIYRAPDLSKLTSSMPGLKDVLERRWLELQKCQHVGAWLAAVVLMGSVLEGLLLARVSSSLQVANTSSRAPKNKQGKILAVHDWNLNALIEVAVDVGWLKVDRGKFSHALRQSRNVVHPWEEIAARASFDAGTSRTCWEVLKASVDDLLDSV